MCSGDNWVIKTKLLLKTELRFTVELLKGKVQQLQLNFFPFVVNVAMVMAVAMVI